MSQDSKNELLVQIRELIPAYFSLEEFRDLCFRLGVGYDDLPGENLPARIRELILLLDRRGRLDDLLTFCAHLRPKVAWPDLAVPVSLDPALALLAAPARNPHLIFLSHARQDADFAHHLATDLRAHGWDVWIAPDSIQPGEKWVEAINRGLAESGIFLLALTPDAVKSNWVHSETNVAIDLQHQGAIRFIPLDVKPVTVPPLWQAYQWIPFQGDYKTGFEQLLQELQSDRMARLVERAHSGQRAQHTRRRQNQLGKLGLLRRISLWALSGGVIVSILALVQFFWLAGGSGDTSTTTTIMGPTPTAMLTSLQTLQSTAVASRNSSSTQNQNFNVLPINAQLGDRRTRLVDDMEMVYVPAPAAPLVLQSGVAAPQEGYWIDKYEVSNAQYQLCVADGDCEPPPYVNDDRLNGPNYPVVGVSWFDAAAYSVWVGGALPTTGEWEYAAVGDARRVYPWGDEFDGTRLNICDINCPYSWKDYAWDDGYAYTAPVVSYPTGKAGWARPIWPVMYGNGLIPGMTRHRLGAWYGAVRGTATWTARVAYHFSSPPHGSYDNYGFRVVIRRPPSQ